MTEYNDFYTNICTNIELTSNYFEQIFILNEKFKLNNFSVLVNNIYQKIIKFMPKHNESIDYSNIKWYSLVYKTLYKYDKTLLENYVARFPALENVFLSYLLGEKKFEIYQIEQKLEESNKEYQELLVLIFNNENKPLFVENTHEELCKMIE